MSTNGAAPAAGWGTGPTEADLEAALAAHPAVGDVAVVARPESPGGLGPTAYVAYVVADWRTSAADLHAHVEARVTASPLRAGDITMLAALPRDVRGAVRRDALRRRPAEPCVLITGGSSGLGRELAGVLAKRGTRVAITARSAERLDEAARSLRATGAEVFALASDVSEPAAVARLVEAVEADFGAIGALVNNAGIQGPIGELWDVDADEWWRTFEINVRGAALGSARALRVMAQRRSGKIINIASHAGVHRWPHLSAYSASKAALIKLTENIAAEVRGYGVAVVSFHPGILEIGLGQTQLSAAARPGSWSEKVNTWILETKARGAHTPTGAAVDALIRLLDDDLSAVTGSYLTTESVAAGLCRTEDAGRALSQVMSDI
jgi:NAD(P)-dependent dehydrogenase (short-subunit alcohol dehydrogenase family)